MCVLGRGVLGKQTLVDGNEDISWRQAMPRRGVESARRQSGDAKETDKNSGQERQTQRQRDNQAGEGKAGKIYMQFVLL